MKYSILSTYHPDIDRELLLDLEALYQGGKKLYQRLSRFIPRARPDSSAKYQAKLDIAQVEYQNYLSVVVNYYASYLFANPIGVRAVDRDGYTLDTNPFYSQFKDDCDGSHTDFDSFLRQRWVDAMVFKSAYWALEKPVLEAEPKDLLTFEQVDAGRITLKPFSPLDLVDYQKDDDGNYEWILFRQDDRVRANFVTGKTLNRVRFWLYDREQVRCFALEYDGKDVKLNADTEIPQVDSYNHGFEGVPVVCLAIPDNSNGLCETLKDPQISHLRARTKMVFAMNSCAYPVTVIATNGELGEMRDAATLVLPENSKFNFSTPPSDAIESMLKDLDNIRVSIFKLANLKGVDVDNKSHPWRSAASKMVDLDVGHVTLMSYAHLIKRAAEQTYHLLSEGRGESYQWQAEDFEQLESLDLPRLTATALEIDQLRIPSPTFKREIFKEIVAKFGADLSDATKQQIQREIDSAPEEALMAEPEPPQPSLEPKAAKAAE